MKFPGMFPQITLWTEKLQMLLVVDCRTLLKSVQVEVFEVVVLGVHVPQLVVLML